MHLRSMRKLNNDYDQDVVTIKSQQALLCQAKNKRIAQAKGRKSDGQSLATVYYGVKATFNPKKTLKNKNLWKSLTPLLVLVALFVAYVITCSITGYNMNIDNIIISGIYVAIVAVGAVFIYSQGAFDMSLGNATLVCAAVGIMTYASTGNIFPVVRAVRVLRYSSWRSKRNTRKLSETSRNGYDADDAERTFRSLCEHNRRQGRIYRSNRNARYRRNGGQMGHTHCIHSLLRSAVQLHQDRQKKQDDRRERDLRKVQRNFAYESRNHFVRSVGHRSRTLRIPVYHADGKRQYGNGFDFGRSQRHHSNQPRRYADERRTQEPYCGCDNRRFLLHHSRRKCSRQWDSISTAISQRE